MKQLNKTLAALLGAALLGASPIAMAHGDQGHGSMAAGHARKEQKEWGIAGGLEIRDVLHDREAGADRESLNRGVDEEAHPAAGDEHREERRPDPGHPRPVGVGLRGYPRPGALCPLNQAEHPLRVPHRGAVDVAVVHVGAGLAGGADDLLGAVDRRFRPELHQVA